jgi:hypothetical protein
MKSDCLPMFDEEFVLVLNQLSKISTAKVVSHKGSEPQKLSPPTDDVAGCGQNEHRQDKLASMKIRYCGPGAR